MNRIFYATDSPLISGGHYVIRDHVAGLRFLGFEAYILASKKSLVEAYARFMPEDWIVVAESGVSVRPEDFVVIPEPWRDFLDQIRKVNVNKILHVQNPFYAFHGLSSVTAINEYRFTAAVCCSLFTAHFLKIIGASMPVFTVRPKVDGIFYNNEKKIKRVCFMPRKRRVEAEFIKGLFFSMYPNFSSVEWIAIDGVSRESAAEIMRSAKVFLSLSSLEGLGLPPIEAMAAGCIPVGFVGGGGAEYSNAGNGYWHSEYDYMGVVRSIAMALDSDESSDTFWRMRQNGLNTAADFNEEKFLSALSTTWQTLTLNSPGKTQ